MVKNFRKFEKAFILSCLISLGSQTVSFAQGDSDTSEDREKLEGMELEDIFKVPVKPEVTVASKRELTIKKSPGIITLITDKEISNSGARDLKEILELIPGFIFNVDVEGGISTGVRGLWAEEGKTLLLVDGQEINDIQWPTVLFGNHIPVEQIKRVEILRGPGSAIYGGQAELAVINVITKSAEDLSGIESKITMGIIPTDIPDFTHRNFSLSLGQKFNDFSFVAHGLIGRGNLSNRTFTDFSNNSYDMTANQQMNPAFFNLGLGYKDFSARFIMDLYKRTTRDLFFLNSPDSIGSIPSIHDGYYAELKYDFKPIDNLTITPKFNYKRQFPWNSDDANSRKLDAIKGYEGNFYSKMAERYLGNLTLNSDITENINIIAGGEYYHDISQALDPKSADFGKDKKQSSISYDNIAAFAQGLYKTDFFTFTLGSRFENHSAYGTSFVPRAALTTTWEDFHAKLLYSKAFRAPGIQNIINFNPKYSKGENIKSENTTVMEVEVGYDITQNMSLTANLFDINIKDPIIYFSTTENPNSYDNFENTGSRGIELEYRIKDKKLGYANLTYSYNIPVNNKVDVYQVPGHNDFLLGFPHHKLTMNTNLKVTDSFSVSPSAVFYSNRFGFNSADKDGNPVINEFSPALMLNLYLNYKDFFVNGLDAGIGIHNLLNQTYYYIQPYNGSHAAMPGPETEISFNLGYNFPVNFGNKQ